MEVCVGRVILALKATFIIGLSWCRLSDARTREFIGKINKLIYFSPVYKGVKLLPTSSPRNGTSNFDHESDFVLTLDPLDNPGDEEIFEWAGLDYQEYRYTLSQLPMSLNSLTDHVRNIGPLFGQLSLVGYFRLFFQVAWSLASINGSEQVSDSAIVTTSIFIVEYCQEWAIQRWLYRKLLKSLEKDTAPVQMRGYYLLLGNKLDKALNLFLTKMMVKHPEVYSRLEDFGLEANSTGAHYKEVFKFMEDSAIASKLAFRFPPHKNSIQIHNMTCQMAFILKEVNGITRDPF